MPTLRILTVLGHFLRHYGLLVLLLYLLGSAVFTTVTRGMSPMPQLPPIGFVAERGMVVLQWHRGSIDAPIRLQVSRTKDFETTVMDQSVSGTTYNYQQEMTRGQTYYWRLLQKDTISPVSSFVISPYHAKL